MEELIRQRIPEKHVDEVEKNINLSQWLEGFGDTERSVRATMVRVKNHPLVLNDVIVLGFIIDSTTGQLTEVKD
jgi:carbonic anhydrase